MNKRLVILVILAVALVGIGIFYWWFLGKKEVKPVENIGEALQAITETPAVPEIEIQSNPVQGKLPELNPVEKTNPFKYRNPFSQ
ncbi:MAG: hypothetical protein HZB99_01375 [Candidatus Harrisonbacteria bacterium]|nr:hypothetical protein [Candidatus Harrisonbacteria bacterium]